MSMIGNMPLDSGDVVIIANGKKFNGQRKRVLKVEPFKDNYGRKICDYAIFTDGTKVQAKHCLLIEKYGVEF